MTMTHVCPKAQAHHFIWCIQLYSKYSDITQSVGEHYPIWITITLYPVDLEVEMRDLS